jgi:hypothetical protein
MHAHRFMAAPLLLFSRAIYFSGESAALVVSSLRDNLFLVMHKRQVLPFGHVTPAPRPNDVDRTERRNASGVVMMPEAFQ